MRFGTRRLGLVDWGMRVGRVGACGLGGLGPWLIMMDEVQVGRDAVATAN